MHSFSYPTISKTHIMLSSILLLVTLPFLHLISAGARLQTKLCHLHRQNINHPLFQNVIKMGADHWAASLGHVHTSAASAQRQQWGHTQEDSVEEGRVLRRTPTLLILLPILEVQCRLLLPRLPRRIRRMEKPYLTLKGKGYGTFMYTYARI